MPITEITPKIVCSSEELFSLEENLKKIRFPLLVKDDVVGVMDRFNKLNNEIQKLICKGGFDSGRHRERMLEVAKNVFREKHFQQFWFGELREMNWFVFQVHGNDPFNYTYADHCLIFVTNMARIGARYSLESKFMELRSGRMIRQPSLEKIGSSEECLPDGPWDRFTRSLPTSHLIVDLVHLDSEDEDMEDPMEVDSKDIEDPMEEDLIDESSLLEDEEPNPEEDYEWVTIWSRD